MVNYIIIIYHLNKLVRKTNEIHPQVINLQYYIFDFPNVSYDIRKKILESSYKKYYQYKDSHTNLIVLSTFVVHSYYDIDNYLMTFLSYKYEGLMMRKMLGINPDLKEINETYYEPKRSYNLLKYKLIISEEGIVIDIVPGEGKESDLAELIIRDIRGNIFKIHSSGSYEMRREWLQNKHKYIGLPYTFKYQELIVFLDSLLEFLLGQMNNLLCFKQYRFSFMLSNFDKIKKIKIKNKKSL